MKRALKFNTRASRELLKVLVPLRGMREVAKIMGVSRGTVFHEEKSALNKICNEMQRFAREERLLE